MADATITLSIIASQQVQADGRIWVQEMHTDNMGVVHPITYLAAAAANLATALATHATNLAATLRSGELSTDVSQAQQFGSFATVTNNYSIQAESDLAIRQAFLTAIGINAINLGDYLRTLSVARLTVAFSLGSVVALQAVLASLGTTATTVRNTVGQ